MTGGRFLRCLATMVAICSTALLCVPARSQVPTDLQQQIQRFDSLTPDQQQALIDQLQQVLPPAQRDAILSQLLQGGQQQQGNASQQGQTSQLAPGAGAPPPTTGSGQANPLTAFGPKRLEPGDTLVIEFKIPDSSGDALASPPPEDEQQRLREMRERLADGNPYKLDSNGQLYLPGIPAIELAGLDIDEAKVRLKAERGLRPFELTLTYLPLEPIGPEGLQPFGYDLFNAGPSTFKPDTAVPVPPDYVVGPGDTVSVQLFGNENKTYSLPVNREGGISFPQIGPVNVAGLTLTELRNTIDRRISEQMIGVRASTTLGSLRSIQIFVSGEVQRPGSYSVSGLSTMTGALYSSGGITPIGSLRKIRLVRNGAVVSQLDLYDLLLRGDSRGDARLQSGDVVFVPPIGATVSVDGEVRRPAIYEMTGKESISDVLQIAGGVKPDANLDAVKLERIVPGRGKSVSEVDAGAGGGSAPVRDGDVISVQRNLEQLENSVRLSGNVFRPGLYEWHSGMTLSELLPSSELVKPKSDLNYVLIRREKEPNVDLVPLSADLQAIWEHRPGARDIVLRPRDTIYVFNLDVGRQHIVAPLLEEMRAEADSNQPLKTVSVDGQVRAPGRYPLEPGMRVSDLLRAGGGLTPSAYTIEAELTRFVVVQGQYRQTDLLDVDLEAALRGGQKADFLLLPYDHLMIKEVPRWREQETVTIKGEVRFPGTYPIKQGERLSSVLKRAGGLTDQAFPEGSVFTREGLRERQAEQLESLATRVESDLASVALSDPNASSVITTGRTLVNQLRKTKAVGRLVINLKDAMAGVGNKDVVLRDGDQLFIPPITQEVMVLGEVQYATSHLYREGLTRQDYIQMSGGVTNRADKSQIYVVRADGTVIAGSGGGRWFSRSGKIDIEPGDTIVVPLNTDRVRPLVSWQGITQILYNTAVAFSVIKNL